MQSTQSPRPAAAPRSPASSSSSSPFCREDNVDEATDYVCRALAAMHSINIPALPYSSDGASLSASSPLTFHAATRQQAAITVNVVLSLLQQHQRDVEHRAELDLRVRRLLSDHEVQLAVVSRTKQRLEQSERECDALTSKLQLATATITDHAKELQQLRDELKATRSTLAHCKAQHAVEVRKRERDAGKLRDRMQKMLGEGYKQAKISVKLVGSGVAGVGGGGISGTRSSAAATASNGANDLYDSVMRNYEEREKEVMVENQQLRKSIYTTLVALREFQHAHKLDTNAVDTNNAAVIAGDDNATAQTHTRLMMLPFEAVRDRIEEEMQFAIDELAVAIGELRVRGQNASTQGSATEKQVSALRGQLEEYRSVIEEQGRLLELSLSNKQQHAQESAVKAQQDQADLDNFRHELERQERQMLAQRNQLENERKQFTEAAIRLGKERALLEREKEDVEELRRAMDTQSLLKELPSTPGWLKHQRPGMTPVRKPTTTAELSTPAALATITNTVLNHPHATGAGGGTPARRSAALLMSTPTGSALKPALRSRATAAADEIGKMTPGGAALSSVYFTPSTPYQGHGGAAPAVAPSSTGSSGKKEVRFVNTGEIDPRGVDAFENWENVRRQADAV